MSFAWHEIRDHLLRSTSTLHFQRRFDRLRRAHPVLLPFRDPAALLDGLHCTHGDPARKNLILTALVAAAQDGGPMSDCALTLLLLALWPGLDAIRHRSIRRQLGSVEEITSDLLARTTEAVRGLDLRRVSRIAATLLRNIERDMVRARQREVARANQASDVDPDAVSAEQAGLQAAPEEAHLADDLRKLIGADAALLIRVAIDGCPQAEAGLDLGLTAAAARKRCQRALARLRTEYLH